MNADSHRQCPKCLQVKPLSEFRWEHKRHLHQIKCMMCNRNMDKKLVLLIEQGGEYQLVGPNGCKKKFFKTVDEAKEFLASRWFNYELKVFKYDANRS